MSETEVILFAEDDGSCPLTDWLDGIPTKAQNKSIVRVQRLAEMGHELRWPEADYLRDGIYELRASLQGIHYRILYFFHDKKAIISHGLIKEGAVPPKEIDLAIERKARFQNNPLAHTYEE
jgi:phage-related protein